MTPHRLRRNKRADPLVSLLLFNPDTRSKHCLPGTIRIFGRFPGHKAGQRDPFQQDRSPARIDKDSAKWIISTDGSAILNSWENTSAGVGVWYADRSRKNISMSLTNHGENTVLNARAELGVILEALRQNKCDDLEIESDSLMSLRTICSDTEKYEDHNWLDIQNTDLLKSILIKLHTRPARTAFKWVKGHDNNYGNNEADKLANKGRESEETLRLDNEEWVKNHSALQDRASLQVLEAKHTYKVVLDWLPKKALPTKYLEVIKEAKNRAEDTTRLCPTTKKLTKGFKTLRVPTQLRDHMRCIVIGKLKCGTFWSNLPGYKDRVHCSFCKKKGLPDTIESEQHMWIDCENNGQSQAWETSRHI